VANGGTGVTTSTGSGANVLSTSPTLTTPISATLTSPATTALTLGTTSYGTALTVASATGNVSIASTTAASSTTSGALQVAGGVGVAGAVFSGGTMNAGAGLFVQGRTVPSSGAGLETYYASNISGLLSYDRTGSSYKGLSLDGSTQDFYVSGARKLGIDASGNTTVYSTTSASSSIAGALTIGNGTAATNVAIGGGNVNAGGTGTFGGAVTASTSGNTGLYVFSTDAATGVPFVRVGYNSNLSGQLSNDASTGKTYLDSRYNDASSAVIIRTKASGTPVVNATFDSTGAATFAGAVTVAGTVIHTLSSAPFSASATGTVGTMSWDTNYIYICTATNTWKRVAIATW